MAFALTLIVVGTLLARLVTPCQRGIRR